MAHSLSHERAAVAIDHMQYENFVSEDNLPSALLEEEARFLHERGMYGMSAVLKGHWRSQLASMGGGGEGLLRAWEYELASAAGLAILPTRLPMTPQANADLTQMAARSPRAWLYGASRLANIGLRARAIERVRTAEAILAALPPRQRNAFLPDYWIRKAQVERSLPAITTALAITEAGYRHTTSRVLHAFILLANCEGVKAQNHFESILASGNSLSWRYRAECWFGLGCILLETGSDLSRAYRYLVAAQYVNAILGLLGIPHPGVHFLGSANGRITATQILARDPRLAGIPRAARAALRAQSLLHSRLQRDLLWDLAGRIRGPINPGVDYAIASGEYYSCVISCSSHDQDFTNRLRHDLTKRGVKCAVANQGLRIGESIRTGIDRFIEEHERVLLVISRRSLGSARVEREVEKVFELELKHRRTILIPIRLDSAVMIQATGWGAHLRRSRAIGDFRHWQRTPHYKHSLNFLLRDLRRIVSA
jgi:hypothetical protein